MWQRIIWLFIMLLLGHHYGIPSSPRYLELADSADFFIAHENWNKAEKTIVEALKLEPANFSNSMLLANLGIVQSQKGEFAKALNSLSLGLSLAPSSTVLLNNRAHTYLMMDSIDNAVKDLDKSLGIDSLQEWTLQTRAYLYLQNKKIDQAEKLLNYLMKNFPGNSSVFSGLAALSQYKGDFDHAKENYLKALKVNGDDDEAREALILLLIDTNDYTGARQQIRQGLERNPENPMFYLLRGYLHRLNYRSEEAKADKKLAISKGLDASYVSSFIP